MLTLRNPYPGAAAAGADVTNFSDWTVGTRPGDSMSEGDFAVDTANGRGYRWDDTIGALLPLDVYGETIVASMKIEGDESSDSDLTANGLVNESSAGATITYNGTSLTVAGGPSSGQNARINGSAANNAAMTTTRNSYCRIVASRDSVPGGGWSYELGMVSDGAHRFRMGSSNTQPFQRTNDSITPIALSLTDDAPFADAAAYVIEMYVKRDSDEDVAHCIVDGKAYHLSALSAHSSTGDAISFKVRMGPNVDVSIYESVMVIY